MKLKPIEKLTFPTIFDGFYLGAVWTGLELIFVVILYLVSFFIFGTDAFQSYLVGTLFATNIFFIMFLKHNGIIFYSVWKEINTPKKLRKKRF